MFCVFLKLVKNFENLIKFVLELLRIKKNCGRKKTNKYNTRTNTHTYWRNSPPNVLSQREIKNNGVVSTAQQRYFSPIDN